MNTAFPLLSARIVAAFLCLSLAAMFTASFRATFSGLSLVEEIPMRGMPEGQGSMPPEGPSAPRDAAAVDAGSGMGFALSDKQSSAVSELMAKLRANPNDAATLMEIGDVFMTVEDWSRAQVFLKRAMISAPSDIRPRFMNAVCQFRMGAPKDAAETFESLLEIKKDPQAMYNLGLLYKYHLQQPDKAKALFAGIAASPDADEELIAKARKEM